MGNVVQCQRGAALEHSLTAFDNAEKEVDRVVDLVKGTQKRNYKACTRVLLRFAGLRLKKADYLSDTDAFVTLYEQSPDGHLTEIGKTEIIENDLDPIFVKIIPLTYFFNEEQVYKLVVCDSDDFETYSAETGTFIGEVELKLQELISSKEHRLTLQLLDKSGKNYDGGVILVEYEEIVSEYNARIDMKLSLPKNPALYHENTSYFYVISRPKTMKMFAGFQTYIPIVRSEVLKYNSKLNHGYKKVKVDILNLLNPGSDENEAKTEEEKNENDVYNIKDILAKINIRVQVYLYK